MGLINADVLIKDLLDGEIVVTGDGGFAQEAVETYRAVVIKRLCCMDEVDPVHAAGGCYCKECKFYREIRTKRYKQIMRWCMKRDGAEFHVQPNDYCSYGRRKEGGRNE